MFYQDKDRVIVFSPAYPPVSRFPACRRVSSIEELAALIKAELPLWEKEIKEHMAMQNLTGRLQQNSHQDFVSVVCSGDRFMTGVFLEAGFDVNRLSSENTSPLAAATRKGHFEIVRILLEAGADLNGISEDRGHSPLMDAAAEGHRDILEFFIGKGADLTCQNKNGQSALVLATGNGHYECAAVLLDAGADCDQSDSMGLSARKYAELYKIRSLLEKMPSRE